MRTAIVASTNPVKQAAIAGALTQMFPHETWQVSAASVASGVSDQPMSDRETWQGAMNRLLAAQQQYPEHDLWAAIEGGVEDGEHGMFGMAWIVVASKDRVSQSRTATFPLPARLAELVRAGVELGHACDQVFGKQNTKQHEGAIGLLTNQVITRQNLYQHAAVMALHPFVVSMSSASS
jgi:inosine/xanthosine triphosphatase